ncbi:MAG: ATP-binding cassette domain-containing protein, partial [Paludibacterium sp.]|uniref:ATP-binding cassette domain-containing protein n=1 Tax=Paludibacterium sp. TaxID=1917523 RepID=UPI0025DDDB15
MLSLHAERLADIVLEKPDSNDEEESDLSGLAPRIELIDVGFRYADSEPWIVRNLNLTIEAGDSLALIGPSGCGKTTLVKLMLGLLQPQEGEIRYGGIAIKSLGLNSYRSILAVVMQDDHLLAGSLADNISFFDPNAD